MAPSPSLAQVYTSPVAVAVWEWQDGLGTWHPYSATVCSYIEQQFVQQKGQRFGLGSLAHSIPLGQADPSLAPYIIDLPSWTQFRQDTGKILLVSNMCQSACVGVVYRNDSQSFILSLKCTHLGGRCHEWYQVLQYEMYLSLVGSASRAECIGPHSPFPLVSQTSNACFHLQ